MKKFSKSVSKYIRQEKARIRRDFLDIKQREQMIADLYKQFGFVSKAKDRLKNVKEKGDNIKNGK